jgi:hypothetical protein
MCGSVNGYEIKSKRHKEIPPRDAKKGDQPGSVASVKTIHDYPGLC